MSKFSTKEITSINGKQKFYQLVDLDDNKKVKEGEQKGVMDFYEESLETKYCSSFKGLLAHMNLVANLVTVSPKKYKDVTPSGERVKEIEFKHGDLRILGIKIPNGQLIILCGYKNQQDEDFVKFRSLKRQYLESLEKQITNDKRRIDKK